MKSFSSKDIGPSVKSVRKTVWLKPEEIISALYIGGETGKNAPYIGRNGKIKKSRKKLKKGVDKAGRWWYINQALERRASARDLSGEKVKNFRKSS